MALDYIPKAWEGKSSQRQLKAVAPATIKKAAQAIEDYLAIEELTSRPKAMPVESTETKPQSPVWEAGLLAVIIAMAKQIALLQQLLTNIETKSVKQQKICFKVQKTPLTEELLEQKQAAVSSS